MDIISDVKTVEQFVEWFVSDGHPESSIDFIVLDFYETLLKILKSKDNKPCKYDLIVINAVNKTINQEPFHDKDTQRRQICLITILDIYKNRKETLCQLN